MASHALYLEYLANSVAEEIAQSAKDGLIERPLNIRRDIECGHGGFIAFDISLKFVPDDLASNFDRIPTVTAERL